jgi:NADH-quinone oxidoreductase subunit E
VPDGGSRPAGGDARAAEAAGVAENAPAGDGKPAGDTQRGESIVGESTDSGEDRGTAKDNPGWTGARRANEEKK